MGRAKGREEKGLILTANRKRKEKKKALSPHKVCWAGYELLQDVPSNSRLTESSNAHTAGLGRWLRGHGGRLTHALAVAPWESTYVGFLRPGNKHFVFTLLFMGCLGHPVLSTART